MTQDTDGHQDINLRVSQEVHDQLRGAAMALLRKYAVPSGEEGEDFSPAEWAVNAVMDAQAAASLGTLKDANNYCRILTLLGMEEEGDPVAKVKDLLNTESVGGQDLLEQNAAWFVATGQMPARLTPDSRQASFYTGMQCEELAEKLEVILGSGSETVLMLADIGKRFKSAAGGLDQAVADAMVQNPKALLDGDVDLLWVSVGAAQAMGADVAGAYGEVNRANWDKRWPDGTFHRAEGTGKIVKPAGWREPDLTPFIHLHLR